MVGCLLAAQELNEGKKVCKKCFCYLLTGPVAPVCSLTQLADDCREQMEQKTCQGCSALCQVSVSVYFNLRVLWLFRFWSVRVPDFNGEL